MTYVYIHIYTALIYWGIDCPYEKVARNSCKVGVTLEKPGSSQGSAGLSTTWLREMKPCSFICFSLDASQKLCILFNFFCIIIEAHRLLYSFCITPLLNIRLRVHHVPFLHVCLTQEAWLSPSLLCLPPLGSCRRF